MDVSTFTARRRSLPADGGEIAYTEFGGGPAAVTAAGGRGRTARSASGWSTSNVCQCPAKFMVSSISMAKVDGRELL